MCEEICDATLVLHVTWIMLLKSRLQKRKLKWNECKSKQIDYDSHPMRPNNVKKIEKQGNQNGDHKTNL